MLPIRPARNVDLLTWVDSGRLNLLSGTVASPVKPQAQPDVPHQQYPTGLRTFLNLSPTQLIGQDQFFASPGQVNQYDWPNPQGKQYPSELRTFINPLNLNLLGQDRFFGAPGEVPAFDYPNPTAGRLAEIGFVFGLNPALFATPTQVMPIANFDFPNPQRMANLAAVMDANRCLQLSQMATPITGFGRLEYTMPRLQLELTLADERLEFTIPAERLEFTSEEA